MILHVVPAKRAALFAPSSATSLEAATPSVLIHFRDGHTYVILLLFIFRGECSPADVLHFTLSSEHCASIDHDSVPAPTVHVGNPTNGLPPPSA